MEMTTVLIIAIIGVCFLTAFAIHKGFDFLHEHDDGKLNIKFGDEKKFFELNASCKSDSTKSKSK